MKSFDNQLNRLLIQCNMRKHLIYFIISLFSLTIIFLNLLLDFSSLGSLFQGISLISTAYIILFLPSYPLIVILLNNKKIFNKLEKLSIIFGANLVFYILLAYLGNLFGLAITGFFFFFSVFGVYIISLFAIGLYELSIKPLDFWKPTDLSKNNLKSYENCSFKKYIEKKINLNGLLLVIFLILLAILHGIRFSYFYGTDAMYHVFMIKLITTLNFLPTNQYFGAMGLHIFGAVIQFFSSIDYFLIAKYFTFYTFTVSGLLMYNIFMRIFKNKNLAILGVLFLEITSLGFGYLMYQFWPTNLATIQSLLIFFLLYARMQNFVKVEKPTKEILFSNLVFTYVFVILIIISAILTHSLISMIYIVSFLFIYIIYFLKNYRRGFDLILLFISLGIFILLYDTSDISSHWSIVNIFQLPWYVFLLGGIAGGILFWILTRTMHFTPGRYNLIIMGKKYRPYKKIEDKYIYPIFLASIIIFSIGFIIVNFLFLDLHFSKIFVAIECFTIIFFAVWGLFVFQYKSRGKIIFLWFFGMLIILLGGIALDFLVLNEFWSGRITLLISPILIIGLMSYFHKAINTNLIKSHKVISLVFIGLAFILIGQFTDQLLDPDNIEYSLHRREVYSVMWFSQHTSDVDFVVCEFGWPYVFYYYHYPYDENDRSITALDLIMFIQEPKGYFKPSDHFYENGTNKLQYLKDQLNTDVILVLDDNYMAFSGFEVFERLSASEMQEYYNMDYINRLFCTKSEYGVEVPYYYVI